MTDISSLTSFLSSFTPQSLYPPPTRPITPRALFLPITTSLFISSTLLSRSTRQKIAIPALLLLASQTRATSTGDVAKDFGRACTVFLMGLKFVDFGLVCEEGEVRRVDDEVGEGRERVKVEGAEQEKGVWRKLWDGADLYLFNMRGIGWNWEVGGIPKREPQSQSYFLLRTTLRLLGSCLVLDLTKYISSLIPYISLSPRPSFFALPLSTQILLTWLHQLEAFSYINIPYQLLALLSVSLRLHPQESWPPLFGSLSDSYLVSRAWGRTWHQLVRRPLSLLTPHAQRFLSARSRSSKRTVSLFSSFFLSGLAHWIGAFNLPWTPSSAGMFFYFMMQAPVIRVEDHVIEWLEQRGFKMQDERWMRWIGFAWTFAWISWSMRYAAAFQFESGPLSRFEPLRWGVVEMVVGAVSW